MADIPPPVVLTLGLLLGAFAGALFMWIRDRLALRDAVAIASRRSVALSRSTLKGQIAEQMAPLLPGFPYQPADARFLGDPIDYVVFNGYTHLKDDNADPDGIEIVILDVKSGDAKLSPTQRAIARAVALGRVRFEVVRISSDGKVKRQQFHADVSGANRRPGQPVSL